MDDVAKLEEDGLNYARLAVQYDRSGQHEQAQSFYLEAAQALLNAKLAGSTRTELVNKSNEYRLRCEAISKLIAKERPADPKTEKEMNVERADFLVRQAFDLDEGGQQPEAAELYMQAADLCLKLLKLENNPQTQNKLNKLALNSVERAEDIKKIPKPSQPSSHQGQSAQANFNPRKPRPLGDALGNPAAAPTKNPTHQSGSDYTKEEIAVLRATSNINGRIYVPFMSVDTGERFAYSVSFSDRDGKLALSAKQKEYFSRWVRPEDYINDPKMIIAVSSFSVKQTVISDCSFVASLAISAQYERRFKQQMITSIIYPQSRSGAPVYNPCGKYMVKLHINGVPRKIIVDDFLPMGRDNQLLCSYSHNRSELWVSILEKAYMKVMGGYDFPGSNSNIDLHALTGWIPERVAIKSAASPFDKDKEFQKILRKFHVGDCVVTVATGALSDADADRAGLVPTHAYAMLDIREVLGKRMLKLKNPWAHLRWKGNYSEFDKKNWTPQMKNALEYEPDSAQQIDNGVFWIDYDSFCTFYECIYINWKPELFRYTTCIHSSWSAKEGPVKDMYNISDNPQYRLELRNTKNEPAAIWALLTRHITDKDDFADNKEFITLFVYKGGARVYYPYDPAPHKDGVKINSPHYLCKMVETGSQVFTLVVSQYEKRNTINYTLRVYAQCPISLSQIVDPYTHTKGIEGCWDEKTAGGCSNFPQTHNNNPVYQVNINNSHANNHLLVELYAPRAYSVGMETRSVNIACPTALGNQQTLASGSYRKGYSMMRMDSISGGVYNITVSTFNPGQRGPFKLEFSSSCPLSISRLK